ncbi:hypothetical protein FTUN_5075 [Frigoriglobus tundricola]|uniref:Uncharacterized protein n=1 Tax=Frigoriglobus tundricola TaxID=2774151 RepID=A0A6M5YW13_9BACT|nr:hypothetical protein FTUN_5075 [Frigoriglobus tundricola]
MDQLAVGIEGGGNAQYAAGCCGKHGSPTGDGTGSPDNAPRRSDRHVESDRNPHRVAARPGEAQRGRHSAGAGAPGERYMPSSGRTASPDASVTAGASLNRSTPGRARPHQRSDLRSDLRYNRPAARTAVIRAASGRSRTAVRNPERRDGTIETSCGTRQGKPDRLLRGFSV